MGTCGISPQKAKLSPYLCTGVLARGNGAWSLNRSDAGVSSLRRLTAGAGATGAQGGHIDLKEQSCDDHDGLNELHSE